MNLSWKIIFWTLAIGLGFVNPVITFVMVILNYLPNIVMNLNKTGYEEPKENSENKIQPHTGKMKFFSDDTLEDSK